MTEMSNEENNTQFHMPGYNYMGPGTKIITNIYRKIPYINYNDHVALHHDIDYVRANGNFIKTLKADIKAIRSSDQSLSGLALKTGLTIRSILSILTMNKINFSRTAKTDEEANIIADYLEQQHSKNELERYGH